jgi:thiosulfate reductase cytochrome b subunit
MVDAAVPTVASEQSYYRHALPIRIMHWINAIAFFVMLMTGLQIFNAHPALNWGKSSYSGRPSILEMSARREADGTLAGTTTVFGHAFNTTGVLGASSDGDWGREARGFPAWATIPGPRWLAMARRWHFFFAWIFFLNGIAYVAYSFATRHVARDLKPTRQDLRSIGQSVKDHLTFRHPRGEAAKRYNVLQKMTYLLVIFVLFPLIILLGWALSPWLDSLIPGWVDFVGGRQTARTLHFIVAFALLGFAVIHIFEVIVSGLWNNLRSMITGRYRVPAEKSHDKR